MIGTVRHLIIVVGCQRSGTTLTGQIMGAHENTVLIDELDGLYPWFHALAENSTEADELTRETLKKSMSKYIEPDARYIREDNQIRLSDNINTIVLKAPNLTYSFRKIASLKLPVHVIYPIRDPRAVVASMRRLSHIEFVDNQIRLIRENPEIIDMFENELGILEDKGQPHWIRAATVWKIKSILAPEFKRCGLPVFQFLYEDLVTRPDLWIQSMMTFCGIAQSETPRNHGSIYLGTGPGGTDRKRAVDSGGIASWVSELDRTAASEILHAAQPLATKFGYV